MATKQNQDDEPPRCILIWTTVRLIIRKAGRFPY
jgi:hypothetical protein